MQFSIEQLLQNNGKLVTQNQGKLKVDLNIKAAITDYVQK